MFLRVVILVFAATCCTARLIYVCGKQSACEHSGEFEEDIMLTDEDRKELMNSGGPWPDKAVPFGTDHMIDICGKHSAWEQSGKFEGDIMLTDEDRKELMNSGGPWLDKAVPFGTDHVINVRKLQYPWEQSGKFEGDIMLTDEPMRTGMIKPTRRWPDNLVPFVIDDVFNDCEKKIILLAIDDYHKKTNIRFKKYDPLNDRDYIHITGEESACWSYIGRIGGRQRLNLQKYVCFSHGTIIHELMHALGFYHMHSATNRDNYVTIFWNNIEPGEERNFNKYNASLITSFGVPYDYESVMHYGRYAFTKNELPTIEPKDPNAKIGQRDGFSEKDILKVNLMYENSSYATRSQFITSLIITLYVLTHLV